MRFVAQTEKRMCPCPMLGGRQNTMKSNDEIVDGLFQIQPRACALPNSRESPPAITFRSVRVAIVVEVWRDDPS